MCIRDREDAFMEDYLPDLPFDDLPLPENSRDMEDSDPQTDPADPEALNQVSRQTSSRSQQGISAPDNPSANIKAQTCLLYTSRCV